MHRCIVTITAGITPAIIVTIISIGQTEAVITISVAMIHAATIMGVIASVSTTGITEQIILPAAIVISIQGQTEPIRHPVEAIRVAAIILRATDPAERAEATPAITPVAIPDPVALTRHRMIPAAPTLRGMWTFLADATTTHQHLVRSEESISDPEIHPTELRVKPRPEECTVVVAVIVADKQEPILRQQVVADNMVR